MLHPRTLCVKLLIADIQRALVEQRDQGALFTADSLQFDRVWVQGIVRLVRAPGLVIDDGSGSLEVAVAASLPGVLDPASLSPGDAVLVAGPLQCGERGPVLRAQKLLSLEQDSGGKDDGALPPPQSPRSHPKLKLWHAQVADIKSRVYDMPC